MGEQLAHEHPADADLVMPVPDTGAAGRGRLRRGVGDPVPRGPRPQPLQRPDVHPAVADDAPARRDDQAQPAPRGRARQAADGRRRLDRAGHDDQADRGPAPQGRRDRGPRPDQRPADLPPLLLRHRHPGRDRADRRDPLDARRSASSSARTRSATSRSAACCTRSSCRTSGFCFACFDGHYPEPVPYDAASRKFMLERAGRPRRCAEARAERAYARAGRRRRCGRAGRRADARRRRVDAPAGGGRRARRVRRRGHDPGRHTASRCSSPRPTASARRPRSPRRSGATTRSASTSSRCAPTTSSAPAPSRCSSSTTWRSGGSTRAASPSSSAAVAAGCREAGCALVGGETAEHPGLMEPDDVRPRRLLRRRRRARRC